NAHRPGLLAAVTVFEGGLQAQQPVEALLGGQLLTDARFRVAEDALVESVGFGPVLLLALAAARDDLFARARQNALAGARGDELALLLLDVLLEQREELMLVDRGAAADQAVDEGDAALQLGLLARLAGQLLAAFLDAHG